MADNPAAENLRQADLARLPLWNGDKKDPFTPEQWCERIQRAKDNSNWDDNATLGYVFNALRGNALIWFDNLKRSGINHESWDAVKQAFLKAYSKVRTARTATVNLAEVKQGNAENVNEYYNRVLAAINDLENLMPAGALQVRATADAYPAAVIALAGFAALPAAAKQETITKATKSGCTQAFNYMGLQHFIANLKPAYRDELMKTNPLTLYTAFEAAAELESINAAPTRYMAGSVTVINEDDELIADEDVDTEIEAMSTRLNNLKNRRNQRGASRGRSRGRGQTRGGRGAASRGAGSGSGLQCFYCKKMGHKQEDCYSRKNAGAPMVDRNGQPRRGGLNDQDNVDQHQQGAPGGHLQGPQVHPFRGPVNYAEDNGQTGFNQGSIQYPATDRMYGDPSASIGYNQVFQ